MPTHYLPTHNSSPSHGYLKAISKVNMHDLSTDPIQHEIRRMSIPKSQNVTNHGHNGQGASVIGAPLEPNLELASPHSLDLGLIN